MTCLKLISLFSLLALTVPALADTTDRDDDWDRIERGMFTMEFSGCTKEGHRADVKFRMTNYSPNDQLPPGYFPATKAELGAAAQVVFAANFNPYIARSLDAETLDGNFLANTAMESVWIEDEGRMVEVSLILKAMNEVKAELMKNGKYSGMGINYFESGVTVNTAARCRN